MALVEFALDLERLEAAFTLFPGTPSSMAIQP
jgi:hypothetical protein